MKRDWFLLELLSFALIAAAALAAILPILIYGIPSGHDFDFHLYGWMEVSSRWQHGFVFPNWAALAHHGFGEARFIFYPPFSWCLGALLGLALPWQIVPGAYIWIVLTLSGYSMFYFARRHLPVRDAVFAACLYAVNPYHLIIVYWRSAYAELMAGILFPLLLLYFLQPDLDEKQSMIPISLLFASALLVNVPSAILLIYCTAFFAATMAWQKKSFRILWNTGFAAVLGAALAAFYLVPVLFERSWVSISQLSVPDLLPLSNFLFSFLANPGQYSINPILSIMGTIEITVLASMFLCARKQRARCPRLGVLALWAGVIAVSMYSIASPVWHYLPALFLVQFPWRLLLLLNVFVAFLAVLGTRSWKSRALLSIGMIGMIVYFGHHSPPFWINAESMTDMRMQIQREAGYESEREYVPVKGDLEKIPTDAPAVRFQGQGPTDIALLTWSAEFRQFVATVHADGYLVLRLFYYPSWEVKVNGNSVVSRFLPDTGQMLIPVKPGRNHVEVRFTETRHRVIGLSISISALFIVLALAFRKNRRATKQRRAIQPEPDKAEQVLAALDKKL